MLAGKPHKATPKGKYLLQLFSTLFLFIVLSCARIAPKDPPEIYSAPDPTAIRDIDTVVYEVKDEYLVKRHCGEWIEKTGSPDVIAYAGIRTIGNGNPRQIEIDPAKLKVVTPGKDSIPLPRIYTLPEPTASDQNLQRARGEYNIQYGDTVFAPVIVRAKQSKPLPAKAMRMKDAAILDIQYLGLEQGLLDPNLNCILEDSKGYIWLGSRNQGICRYDGTSFTYFKEKDGLNDYITAIIEDRAGNIWIGTGWGIFKYDGKNFTHYYVGDKKSYSVLSIVEARNGNIWFGTQNGMLEYNGIQWTHYTDSQGLYTKKVLTILEDTKGNIWTGGDIGICKYDGTSFTPYYRTKGLRSDFVRAILEDKNGNLWIGSTAGVCKYDRNSFIQFTLNEGLPENIVNSIMEDSSGEIWMGTYGGGVYRYHGGSFTKYTSREGLSSNIISTILEDKGGNMWFTTVGAGVMKFKKNSFSYFAQFEDVSKGSVNSIAEAQDGKIMFAKGGGGILIYENDSFRNINMNHGLPIDYVSSLYSTHNNTIWIGTVNGGINKYDGESLSYYGDLGGPAGSGAKYIMVDKEGNIWAATFFHGIKKFDGDTITYYLGIPQEPDALINRAFPKYATCIIQDSKGNIWYNGDNSFGAYKYDGDFITHYMMVEDSTNLRVTTIFEDKGGNIWLGTRHNGVYKYDGRSFTHFTEKQGLSNNGISSIIEDGYGNIWIGTKKGLSRLSPKGKGNYSIAAFGTEDGLKNLNFIENSVCLDSRNRLWWGTGEVATMLDLNTFTFSPEPPVIQLNNMLVNQEFIDFGSLSSAIKFQDLTSFNNNPIDPELPYYLNHLNFNFSAIACANPQKIRYQYMVEGLEDQWGPLIRETSADYRNIPPGKYTFKLRAIGEANILSETFEYAFKINRPWWLKWWTFTFYCLLLLLITRFIVKYLVGRERIKAQVQIKQVEVEKMQELDQIKSRFFANISHEFRTPLTLLVGPINDFLKKPGRLADDDNKLLKIMKRNAGRLQQLIDQLLDLSRLETGKLKLEVTEGDLTGLIRSIVLSFLSLAESKKINYSYELEESSFSAFFDKDKIEKIVMNLVSNALKFTPEGRIVRITLHYIKGKELRSGCFAELLVKDTGPGISLEEQGKIFDRFYQVSGSDSRNHEGSGIGLALAKELAELHGGDIRVESMPGEGSTFKVKLSVSRDQFDEAEILTVSEKQTEPGMPDDPEVKEADTLIHLDQIKQEKKDLPVILIVEDNSDLRNYIAQNLLGNYKILQAENGNEGLQTAIEYIPDLVISDLMMPEMDGMEMCTLLKSDPKTNHIPLIMLTAKADRDSKLESLETGADDYILKPFDAEELEVRVRNLISQRMKLRERYRKEFMADIGDQEIPPPEDEFMVRVMKCMNRHLTESEFNVEQMRRELGLSRTQLYRKILAITDHTPSEFIRSNRLKMAARMFLEGHKNVTSVMYSVGFDTSVNFAKHFRKMFGVNPSEYIKHTAEPKK